MLCTPRSIPHPIPHPIQVAMLYTPRSVYGLSKLLDEVRLRNEP